MVDYWAYTKDTTYQNTTTQALLAQIGPAADFMVPAQAKAEGNDDQQFWALAAMTALEYEYPTGQVNGSTVQWLDLAVAAFNTMVPRWDTTSCGGGLKWQIFTFNNGYDYKNAISQGGFFQLAARLARYTGNQTYVDWANKAWDWSWEIGLIDRQNYNVYDGTDDLKNCSDVNHMQWSYNVGMFLYGAANLYNVTNGSSIWQDRVTGLVQASGVFFSPYDNATDVMFEAACEQMNTCNTDQKSFKAYLARWLAKTSILAPYTAPTVQKLIQTSAQAAAQSCVGTFAGNSIPANTACGARWYTGGWDGSTGVGEQLSAMEVIQALLIGSAPVPMTQAQVHISNATPTASKTSVAVTPRTATAGPTATGSAGRAGWSFALTVMAAFVVASMIA